MASHCKSEIKTISCLFTIWIIKEHMSYRNSSAISEHKLWRSICEFFREFQQNSKTATIIATSRPPNRTTKTPPIFLTLNGLALESLLLSCDKLRKFTGVSKNINDPTTNLSCTDVSSVFPPFIIQHLYGTFFL